MRLTHGRAAALMVLVTLLWSIAGVVTRHLDAAASFEVTFWRSAFNALGLGIALHWMRGPALWRGLVHSPWSVWVSGLCWSVMFTAFMVALTLTRVANVLVTMALGPLITALFARLFLHHKLAPRTWAAIVVAGAGIGWMFSQGASANEAGALAGIAVAFAVPVAAAINWTVLQHVNHGNDETHDMLPAVLIGAVISSLVTLPLALPFKATPHDVALLGMLGVVQLAIPCLLVVRLSRVLPAPELSLLGLLEVIFGVLWAWWGAGEAPGTTALTGGALVIGALVANELVAMRSPQRASEKQT
ncbi:DMT family transporter [Piscinibacter gummiphilus]|uniref:DMT family transporter n=1 Tax=Piscinibacter gummiphilus TaxID=946333 RepID=A0ABZ0D689_9BURK|nr:DMT family transporter [Piscinibacter gummiphilus]WOB10782.1 DMT family transporter [Piscinibacter gummiphilus]